jgi:hypothetical protein
MGMRHVLPVLVIVSLLLPVAAFAGAPNYDCTLQGGRGRLAIDQWRPKVVAIGVGSHATVGGAVGDITQDGPSLDFTTTLSGIRWSVAIRDYGKSLTMTGPDATLTGRCLFVPGNFILRAADRGGHVLRAAPLARASALLSVQVGAPVWESPSASPKGKWLPVLVVQANGLTLSSASGWLRQVGPYQGRAN